MREKKNLRSWSESTGKKKKKKEENQNHKWQFEWLILEERRWHCWRIRPREEKKKRTKKGHDFPRNFYYFFFFNWECAWERQFGSLDHRKCKQELDNCFFFVCDAKHLISSKLIKKKKIEFLCGGIGFFYRWVGS